MNDEHDLTLHVWLEGDRTAGNGTLTATVEIQNRLGNDEDLPFLKRCLAHAFAQIWDDRASRVHVMTAEEMKPHEES